MIRSRFLGSKIDADDFRSPPGWLALAETFVVTGGTVVLGYLLHPGDPFFLHGSFAWLAFAPLVLGLRYGFLYGLSSALILSLGMAISWRAQLLSITTFPTQLAAGLVICGMLAGEFSDMWTRRLKRFGITGGHLQMRLDEFTRTFHLLKISHDQLEQRLAGSVRSLREALMTVRMELVSSKDGKNFLSGQETRILNIFAAYGSVQVASLYAVGEAGLITPAAAHLGSGISVTSDDPIIGAVLSTGRLITIRDSPASHPGTSLLAAVPIVDVYGRIWAIVAIREMMIVAFTERNLKTLAIIAGHIADVVALQPVPSARDRSAAEQFLNQIRRGIEDIRRYDLPSVLMSILLERPEYFEQVGEVIIGQRRRLDQYVWQDNDRNQRAFLILMQLTDEPGASIYLTRLEESLKERLGSSFRDVGLKVHAQTLNKTDRAEQVMADAHRRLGIHEDRDIAQRAAS